MIHLRLVNDNLHEARADIERLKDHISSQTEASQYYVDTFTVLKNSNKIVGMERDIYFWMKKPPKDFIEFIDDKLSSISKNQERKHIKRTGSRYVTHNDDWAVYAILNHDACKYYGRNTKWCITEDSDYYWRKYLLQGYRFYFLIRKHPDGGSFDKLAFQCKGRKVVNVWDSSDTNHALSDLAFLNLPDISDDIIETSKSRKIGQGLRQNAHNVLYIQRRNLPEIVKIPNSISVIPEEGFSGADIKEVIFDNNSSLRTLSNGVFFNCDALSSVSLPEGLETLSRGVFHSCSNLDSIELPSSLKAIGPYCFTECTSLEEVSIPKNVISIEEGAFKSCVNLSKAEIYSSEVTINPKAFLDCGKLTIYASEKSPAHIFANDNNIDFKPLARP